MQMVASFVGVLLVTAMYMYKSGDCPLTPVDIEAMFGVNEEPNENKVELGSLVAPIEA